MGADVASDFVGKNLDQKLAAKLTKEFKLRKCVQVYDAASIENEALRFTFQLLVGRVLRKCRPTKVPTLAMELVASTKEGKLYN